LIAAKKLEFVGVTTFTRYFNSNKEEAKDERFLPCDVGCYTYRALWE